MLVILIGGIKRIGRVAEKLVPFMALYYIIFGLLVVIHSYKNVPGVFRNIFEGAFAQAITGGVVGRFYVYSYEERCFERYILK